MQENIVTNAGVKRNLSIDIARVMFTIIVFLNHSTNLVNPSENVPLYFRYGFLGVEFFFILSGYLMCAKANRQKDTEVGPATLKFVFGKIKTIFPYFFAAYVIALIIDGFGKGVRNTILHIVQSLPVLLQINMAGYNGYQVLGPSWYISCMLLCMLVLYPPYCFITRKHSRT